jgi:hypothetical protein
VRADLDNHLYRTVCHHRRAAGPRRGPGRRPKLTDPELVCLAVAQVLLGFGSVRRWRRFASRRLGQLFAYLPTASAYNRRFVGPGRWSPGTPRRPHLAGLWVRFGQRLLALATGIWWNWEIGAADKGRVPQSGGNEGVVVNLSDGARAGR